MTSKQSFNDTARYWTHIYAGGPEVSGAVRGSAVPKSNVGQDEIAMAGLEKAHVDQFESLGFPRSKVVRSDLFYRLYSPPSRPFNLSPPDRSLEATKL